MARFLLDGLLWAVLLGFAVLIVTVLNPQAN